MKTSIQGFPRIGARRELKAAEEACFRGELGEDSLITTGSELRKKHWLLQRDSGLDCIPSNDFSFYDGLLDTAVLFDLVPARYRDLGLSPLRTIFAMARGHQGAEGDVTALPMKKWFNTNYHSIEPELSRTSLPRLRGGKPFEEYLEAKALGIETRPVIIGPLTLLALSAWTGPGSKEEILPALTECYAELLNRFSALGTEWVELAEPILVTDQGAVEVERFRKTYAALLERKENVKLLLGTWFGDLRDVYPAITALPFDGVEIDLVEGTQSLELLESWRWHTTTTLVAGVVNGKNVWRNDYGKTLGLIERLQKVTENIILSSSCPLLHVPCSLEGEEKLGSALSSRLAFATEKLGELADLKALASLPREVREADSRLKINRAHFASPLTAPSGAEEAIARLGNGAFARSPARRERADIQRKTLALPLLPTTTIGSFPQTGEVQRNRALLRKGELSGSDYDERIRALVKDCVREQEELGLDVLVHGEFERNDMVEFFGEQLEGFAFTRYGWVQSYGTRCVKPPIVIGEVKRKGPMTVPLSVFAQSLTDKPVKGMLTGPVTILNWSFPREDVPLRETALETALALREEVLELEKSGIRIIQIDEAALKEKLPLRREERDRDYLSWAIPAFRLVHSGVRPETQIHTHMCYSEFADIIADIDRMDADVISFEAARSGLAILEPIVRSGFQTAVGPGIWDIHSPRVPPKEELKALIRALVGKLGVEKLWINPDCGLKTRGREETMAALRNLVAAAREVAREVDGAGESGQ